MLKVSTDNHSALVVDSDLAMAAAVAYLMVILVATHTGALLSRLDPVLLDLWVGFVFVELCDCDYL